MNTEIDVASILKANPQLKNLYSPLYGNLHLKYVGDKYITLEIGKDRSVIFHSNGKFFTNPESECLLFPSREERTWDRFLHNIEFHPKDWCLMRKTKEHFPYIWHLCRFAYRTDSGEFEAVGGIRYRECLPYNDNTKHLLGTTLDYKY